MYSLLDQLTSEGNNDRVLVNISREQLEGAPRYKPATTPARLLTG